MKKRCSSAAEKHLGAVKEKILKIYEDFHQNYSAPKITRELWKSGKKISLKTVANYIRQMGIKAQWVKPYTQPTIDSDFSKELIILDYNLPVSLLAGFNALNNIPMLHFVEIILHTVNFPAQFSYYFFLSDIVLLFDCRQYGFIFFRHPNLDGNSDSFSAPRVVSSSASSVLR
ncbi:IS3 family transposase [Mordavella massiliensis]|uniref:Transposase n=1 Tax=Mordavella massiliensis TaxID=1871024 RepID=A0A938X4X3_9CLOT|nr:IS3 family transposase [Mordavella massiliensis]MBM6827946.1 transposase [Mordavella massiliensis]